LAREKITPNAFHKRGGGGTASAGLLFTSHLARMEVQENSAAEREPMRRGRENCKIPAQSAMRITEGAFPVKRGGGEYQGRKSGKKRARLSEKKTRRSRWRLRVGTRQLPGEEGGRAQWGPVNSKNGGGGPSVGGKAERLRAE